MEKKTLPLTPLSALRVERHQIPAHGLIPNTSIGRHPLIIYRGLFATPAPPSPEQIEGHIAAVGVCEPMWRYPMYPDDHFHTTAHELVVIHRGRARLNFGGEGCVGAVVTEAKAGDAVLIPAGVSHRLVEDLEGEFEMVGSYMVGSEHWDMCYGKPGEEDLLPHIAHVEWFSKDPLYGEGGPAASA
ncbi:RmlC-like cupin domain-containing protein [Lenzites betulinus]|nr:RmlC-like cupin domain-containing protein [Lenzites betulinus]